jgi:hypothetical protein
MKLNLYIFNVKMLIINVNIPTPYQKMKIFSGFDDVDVDERRKTKDETASIKKEQ